MLTSAFSVVREVISRKLRSRAEIAAESEAIATAANEVLGQQRMVAVDVGAANGLLPHWEALDGVATIYQVEPRADACRELERINAGRRRPELYHVVQAALSETGGPATLYVTNAPTGSSLLPFDGRKTSECDDYIDLTYRHPITELLIETETLANLVERNRQTRVDLIKLDIQGAELPVLKGLGPTMSDGLLGAEIEIGLHDFFPQEVGLEAIIAHMRDHGLELFDVRVARVHRPRDNDHSYYQRRIFSVYDNSPTVSARIWEFDAVFFRRKSLVLATADAATLRRMMVVYCVYNFYSEAYSLAEKAAAASMISAAEASALKSAIVALHRRTHARSWLADTPAMNRWRQLMYRIAPRSAPRWCQYMYQNYPSG